MIIELFIFAIKFLLIKSSFSFHPRGLMTQSLFSHTVFCINALSCSPSVFFLSEALLKGLETAAPI